MSEFGDVGLFHFRDTPEITHWKKVENDLVWHFSLFEWLFVLKGKANLNAHSTFTPCSTWDSFLRPPKPYVAQGIEPFQLKPRLSQGSRFLRRDLRIWIKTGKTSGILRNLYEREVDVRVIMSIKHLMAFEQSVGNEGFPDTELSKLPSAGTGLFSLF
jgi:hypothetical protein